MRLRHNIMIIAQGFSDDYYRDLRMFDTLYINGMVLPSIIFLAWALLNATEDPVCMRSVYQLHQKNTRVLTSLKSATRGNRNTCCVVQQGPSLAAVTAPV